MASYPKFIKSFQILREMFTLRQKSNFDLYSVALKDLEKYINENRFSEDFSRYDILLDFGAIRLVYNMDEKWDPRDLKQSRRQLIQENSDNVKHFIFVFTKPFASASDMTCIATQPNDLSRYVRKNLKKELDIFFLKELQYNVTKHHLVPLHEIVVDTKNMYAKIMDTYGVKTLTQLPLILTSDPVIRFIGGRDGDIIKI